MKNLLLAGCLSIAGIFAFSGEVAKADHGHHGYHYSGHLGYGHGHGQYYYRPYYGHVYHSYPRYYDYYPSYRVYHYDYYRPYNHLSIQGRNFGFSIGGH